ncbi:MAG: L-threonylcarbamoyladenylate synthase [Treponema sp.]|nr:L-threonylcarbamoyladenylate synthase [Treponema sp.]
MIEYIVPTNIDDRLLSRTVKLLSEGGTVAIPTDTSWNIVCSFNSRDGVKRLKAISRERDERLFTLLCCDISQFSQLCSIDNTRFRLIKRISPGPYVFILKTLHGTEKVLGLRRHEIGVRLPDFPVPQAIINALGCPLYGITAKRNMALDLPEDADDDYEGETESEHSAIDSFYKEDSLFDGGWELEGIRGLDLVLDPGEDQMRIFSTVLDISGEEVKVLRQGAGHWPV